MSARPDRKPESAGNSGSSGSSGGNGGTAKRADGIVTRNAMGKAHMNLAKALATVFSAGVYTKEELQGAVCTFVSAMKDGGETGEGVVREAQSLVNEIGARFPSSERTQLLLTDMVTWCLAEYYRETA
jgi:hypothetical protein